MNLNRSTLLALAVALLAGCATSTLESRRTERADSYAALTPETRELVDKGKLKIGMSMDAVYIAWGKPSRILSGESDGGKSVTWLYHSTTMEAQRYWNYRYVPHGRRYQPEPFLDYDYYPRHYTSAEVVFENGVVKSWRTLAPQ
ncbi:MAG: hypothetical protein HZA90_25685 [Verrucomicrobia bacterium]|nr:hypothetical protein [Verrucomicrobiota bacterium]